MQKIGFIGLGIMGKPMALNLLKAGYPLTVFNRSIDRTNDIISAGGAIAHSPKAVAEVSDVVISMVPDTAHVEEVALGNDGIIHGLHPGLVYIDMSTIAAGTEKNIYAAFKLNGVDVLDAPVSGGEVGAINATLSIMVGGDEHVFEKMLPIFEVMGKKISYMGDIGAGQITKQCNQVATALITQGIMEALTLAKKAGVDIVKVRNAMLGGFAQSRALELAGQRMIDRNFEPGFSINLYRKDLGLAQNSARSLSVPLMGTSLVASEMDALIAKGKGLLDFSALVQITEELSGL
jgi:2-hydroxy-3-oxopropionate reductase